jgi:hypothetical protein
MKSFSILSARSLWRRTFQDKSLGLIGLFCALHSADNFDRPTPYSRSCNSLSERRQDFLHFPVHRRDSRIAVSSTPRYLGLSETPFIQRTAYGLAAAEREVHSGANNGLSERK